VGSYICIMCYLFSSGASCFRSRDLDRFFCLCKCVHNYARLGYYKMHQLNIMIHHNNITIWAIIAWFYDTGVIGICDGDLLMSQFIQPKIHSTALVQSCVCIRFELIGHVKCEWQSWNVLVKVLQLRGRRRVATLVKRHSEQFNCTYVWPAELCNTLKVNNNNNTVITYYF